MLFSCFLVFCASWYFFGYFLFEVVSTSAIDCLERPSQKWPITCRERS